jgi:hypothetical protein
MTVRAIVCSVDSSALRHSDVWHGPARVIVPALRAINCPWQYDHQRRGYLVPKSGSDHLAAALETGKTRVRVQLAAGW